MALRALFKNRAFRAQKSRCDVRKWARVTHAGGLLADIPVRPSLQVLLLRGCTTRPEKHRAPMPNILIRASDCWRALRAAGALTC